MREKIWRAASLATFVVAPALVWVLASYLSYDIDQINRDATIPSKNPRHVTGVCQLPVVLDENTKADLPSGHPYEGWE